MKKWGTFLAGVLAGVLLWYGWSRLSDSHKRYLIHLLKQVRYMPARYKV
ncbi:MAG: hypothetical protein AAGU05_01330 [Anaerolineaceae bacterium]